MNLRAALVQKDGSVTWVDTEVDGLNTRATLKGVNAEGQEITFERLSLTEHRVLLAVYFER